MIEQWKDIEGYEGYYQVSSLGGVRSVDRVVEKENTTGLRLKGMTRSQQLVKGYPAVTLCKDSKYKHIMVHRLVAIAFIPNPEKKLTVNHKDGNKQNNSISNLEWATLSENCKHAWEIGLSKGRPKTKYYPPRRRDVRLLDTEIDVLISDVKEARTKVKHGGLSKVSSRLGIHQTHLAHIIKGNTRDKDRLINVLAELRSEIRQQRLSPAEVSGT